MTNYSNVKTWDALELEMFTWSRLLTTLKRSRRMKVIKVLIVDSQFILIGLDNHYSCWISQSLTRFQDVLLSLLSVVGAHHGRWQRPCSCFQSAAQSRPSHRPQPLPAPERSLRVTGAASEASERLMLSAEAGPCPVTLTPSHCQHSQSRGPRV